MVGNASMHYTYGSTISLEVRMIDSLSTKVFIKYPTSEYVQMLYGILLFARNVINSSRILADKVIKGENVAQSF